MVFPKKVECKAAAEINKRHPKGIVDYLRTYSLKTGIVISFAPFGIIDLPECSIINLPAYLLERLEDACNGLLTQRAVRD